MALCTLAQYRTFTGDQVRYDGAVTDALAVAQAEIERLTERVFESATVTETLRVKQGYVYPVRYPVTAVSVPSGAVLASPAVYVGESLGILDISLLSVGRPVTVVVTYTGGFVTIPVALQRLCAEMAQQVLLPSAPAVVPSDASTEDLDGPGYPALSTLVDWPPEILARVRQWSHIRTRLG